MIKEFLLPYAVVQASTDPRASILDFLGSTYAVGAKMLGWPADLTRFDLPARTRAKATTG